MCGSTNSKQSGLLTQVIVQLVHIYCFKSKIEIKDISSILSEKKEVVLKRLQYLQAPVQMSSTALVCGEAAFRKLLAKSPH